MVKEVLEKVLDEEVVRAIRETRKGKWSASCSSRAPLLYLLMGMD